MKGGKNNVCFQRKTGHISKTMRDRATNREVAYALSDQMTRNLS